MTGDDRLRADLRSLEEAAPADLPPRSATSRAPRWLPRAALAAVVILGGVMIGVAIPAWLDEAGPSSSRVGDLVQVPTQRPEPSGEPALCMQALIQGTLARHAEYGLAIANGDTTTPVMWPHGYVAREGAAGLELLDAAGAVVAREGDVVQLGGGEGGGMWIACPAPEVIPRELTGQLEGDPSLEGGCIWLRTATGRRWPIDWPDEYREEFRDGQPVLLHDDEVVAEAGDRITVRGGAGDFGFACIGFNSYAGTEIVAINPVQAPADALRWETAPFADRGAAFGDLELVGDRLVAVGSIDDEPAAWYSDNGGASWVRASLNFRSLPRAPVDLRSLRSLVASGTILIAAGSDESVDPHLDHLWLSRDRGETWTWTRSPTDQIASLTSTAEGFVMFGLNIVTYEERDESFWRSSDGLSWAPVEDEIMISRIRAGPLAEHSGVAVAAVRTPRDPPSAQPPRVWVQRNASPGSETAVMEDPGGIYSVSETASGFVAAGYTGPLWEDHRAAMWVSDDGGSWDAFPMQADSGSIASSTTSNDLGMVIFGWFDVPQWALDFDHQYVWFSPGGTEPAVPQEVGGTIRAFIALHDRFIGLGETCDNEGNCHAVLFNAVAEGEPAA
jgi:hypothetical protein